MLGESVERDDTVETRLDMTAVNFETLDIGLAYGSTAGVDASSAQELEALSMANVEDIMNPQHAMRMGLGLGIMLGIVVELMVLVILLV